MLLVVFFHAGFRVRGGFIGVDVFFVISGFVIGRGLVSEAHRTGRVDLGRFYARRVRRLLPALAVMLTIVSIASVLVLAPAFPQPNALRTALAATFSGSNLFLWLEGGGYFTPLEQGNPFVHTWSLGVEEQFYLVFPLFVFASWRLAGRVRRLGNGRKAFTSLVVAVLIVSVVCSMVLTFGGTLLADVVPQAERFAFYGPITRIWEFLAGVLIALWWAGDPSARSKGRRTAASWAGVAGLVLIGVSAFSLSAFTPFPGVAAVLPVAGTSLVIASGTGVSARFLENPVLVWLGDRSYSWYLWHWPAIVLLPVVFPWVPGIVPIAAFVSLVPAVLSYRFLEQRFRLRRGAPARFTAPRLAAASVAMPCVVLAVALFGMSQQWGLEQHPELEAASVSQKAKCFESWTSVEQCTFGDDNGGGTIMLVGDSHADTISDAVIEAASTEGYEVVIQTYLACPFLTVPLEFEPGCLARQASTSELIAEVRPDVLVIANNSRTALSLLDNPTGERDFYDPPSAGVLETWESALRSTFVDVEPSVGRVLLFSVVPYYEPAKFDSALPTLLRPTGTFPTVSTATIERSRGPIVDAEARAAESVPGLVTTVDPLPLVCPDGLCTLRSPEGLFRNRDGNHLSNPIARQLDGLIVDALQSETA